MVDWKVFEEHFTSADAAVDDLIDLRRTHVQQFSTTQSSFPSRFGFNKESGLAVRNENMKELATRMNAHQMDCGFIDYILKSKSFQHCVKLTNDEDDMAKWFNDFVVSDDSEITALCHRILCKFLSYLEDAIFGKKKHFI